MRPSRSRSGKPRRWGWIITTESTWISDAPAKSDQEGVNGRMYYLDDDGAPQVWDGREFSQIAVRAYRYKSKDKADRRAFWIVARCPELIGALHVKRLERSS